MPSYLEKRRQGYYAVVEVPPSLREKLGCKRLRRSLNTRDPATANARKWAVVAEFKTQIEAARRGVSPDSVKAEARAMRTELHTASPADAEAILYAIEERANEIRGAPLGMTEGGGPADTEYDPAREKRAIDFYKFASGQTTPLHEYLDQWLLEVAYTERTKGDHRRAVQRLADWPEGGIETIEAVTRKKAGEFISWLLRPRGQSWTGDRKTAAKYKSSLSSYWAFLKGKGHVETNPWPEQTISKPKVHLEGTENAERPFTDEEVLTLLSGQTDQMTADLIRMGALTGMRIDELCRLTVAMTEGGHFKISKAKTPAGMRSVPIHSDLRAIVARRCEGKEKRAYLFDELPEPPKESGRERSMPASKRFGRYMRARGVAKKVEGKRRSLVNFHSFRRWFITKAEQAGQPETIIAAVVGHKRQGMTLGHYSGGPSGDQYRACVEAVRLPTPSE